MEGQRGHCLLTVLSVLLVWTDAADLQDALSKRFFLSDWILTFSPSVDHTLMTGCNEAETRIGCVRCEIIALV